MFLKVQLAKLQPPRKSPDARKSDQFLLIYSKAITRQGHPTAIFGKYLFGRLFEIYNFRNICCEISCLPASPRIFEHL